DIEIGDLRLLYQGVQLGRAERSPPVELGQGGVRLAAGSAIGERNVEGRIGQLLRQATAQTGQERGREQQTESPPARRHAGPQPSPWWKRFQRSRPPPLPCQRWVPCAVARP